MRIIIMELIVTFILYSFLYVPIVLNDELSHVVNFISRGTKNNSLEPKLFVAFSQRNDQIE